MNITEAKEKYRGIKFKEKGFYVKDQTQLIYKSDLKTRDKLGFLIEGNVHLLQDPLRTQLDMILKKQLDTIPAGIVFDRENENFKIPLSYLPIITTEVSAEPTVVDATLNVGTYTSGSYQLPVLNKVAQIAGQTRFLDSLDFYKSVILERGDVEDQLSVLTNKLITEPTEENLSKLILAGIVYLEMIKE